MSRKGILLLASTVALAAAPALAQSINFDDEKAKLDAQLELVNKQQQLQEALRRLGTGGAAAGGMPMVVAVVGLDGQLAARLQLPNGVVRTYFEGEAIRPGMVVSAITPRAVMMKVGAGAKAKPMQLDFVAGGTQAAGQGGLPPLPPDLLPEPPSVRLPAAAPTPGPSRAVKAEPASPAPAPVAAAGGAAPEAAKAKP